MDATTQRNAVLVEQAAAAAGSMQDEAKRLAALVTSFRLGARAPRPAGLLA
jgi:methyl-accepting chemotaxis protein